MMVQIKINIILFELNGVGHAEIIYFFALLPNLNFTNKLSPSMVKGIIIGIIIGIIVVGGILLYTNTLDVLKPEIESSVDTAKDAISKVDGNDVVEKAEEVSNKIKDVTEKIKVTNPLEPKE